MNLNLTSQFFAKVTPNVVATTFYISPKASIQAEDKDMLAVPEGANTNVQEALVYQNSKEKASSVDTKDGDEKSLERQTQAQEHDRDTIEKEKGMFLFSFLCIKILD